MEKNVQSKRGRGVDIATNPRPVLLCSSTFCHRLPYFTHTFLQRCSNFTLPLVPTHFIWNKMMVMLVCDEESRVVYPLLHGFVGFLLAIRFLPSVVMIWSVWWGDVSRSSTLNTPWHSVNFIDSIILNTTKNSKINKDWLKRKDTWTKL